MAKINRIKLSHGTKLVPEHLTSSIGDATDVLLNANVEHEQIDTNRNSFYVSVNIPVVRSSWGEVFGAATGSILEAPFPFMLPPTQEEFSTDYHANEKTITLDELMFSFDQNGNALAMTDFFDANEKPGLLYDGVSDNYTVRIRIYEKTPTIIGSTTAATSTLTPELIVFQADYSSVLFSSVKFRNNPFVQPNIDVQINPYKTYILTISFPDGLENSYTAGMVTQTRNAMLPSVNIRAKFSNRLLGADLEADLGAEVQNLPDVHLGQNTFPPNVTVPTWNPTNKIPATTSGGITGIQTSLDAIDYYAVKGYAGGLDKASDVLPNGVIRDMYGYDVICVPMFQSMEQIRRGWIFDAADTDFLPYVPSGTVNPEWFLDRRIISISHPFTIHHVFCSTSFYANKSDLMYVGATQKAQEPGIYRYNADIEREVGVFIGTGIRADHYGIQQVAYGKLNEAYPSYLVDKIQLYDEKSNSEAWGSVSNYTTDTRRVGALDSELWQVPINYGATRTGYGYSENGSPFFTGQGNLRTKSRTEVYDRPFDFAGAAASRVPRTRGAEQWIEVRAKISASGGLGYDLPGEPTDANLEQYNDIVLGRGGWYVYLVGKRALTY